MNCPLKSDAGLFKGLTSCIYRSLREMYLTRTLKTQLAVSSAPQRGLATLWGWCKTSYNWLSATTTMICTCLKISKPTELFCLARQNFQVLWLDGHCTFNWHSTMLPSVVIKTTGSRALWSVMQKLLFRVRWMILWVWS